MKKLSSKDLSDIIREEIQRYIQRDTIVESMKSSEKFGELLEPGLTVKEKSSGLTYTIVWVTEEDIGLRSDDTGEIVQPSINRQELNKNYERD